MSADLEKARAEVIDAIESYIRLPGLHQLRRFDRAIQKRAAIERQSKSSDGGRMNEQAVGGENGSVCNSARAAMSKAEGKS